MSSAALPIDPRWGKPPWRLTARVDPAPLPEKVDVAIVGGGFTGLAVACWLRRLAPERSVALLEASHLGAGASGRTGGIVLDETPAGALPELGAVLGGFAQALVELGIDCDLKLSGVWEIARSEASSDSPIAWQDSGLLRVAEEVPGGTLDPGALLSGLARVAQASGARLYEHAGVHRIRFEDSVRLELTAGELSAQQVVQAVNASGLELAPWPASTRANLTLAVATAPLSEDQLRRLGLAPGKPFYTLDLPYLWGSPLADHRLIFGGGLVHVETAEELAAVDVRQGEAVRLLESLQARVRGLHPVLGSVEFTHRWGGPILFAPAGRPILCRHPESPRGLVLGGYTGQGIALSVYLARWAAKALLGGRHLPNWGQPED
ncbi:MAG: NAD(P)/FAD-dependent oxidoreductase [Terriglobia bacterium]